MNFIIREPREGNEEDINFVRANWIEPFRNSPKWRHDDPKDYYAAQEKVIAELLPKSTVLFICPDDDPDFIVGFIAYQRTEENLLVVHYIYVKEGCRNEGFARDLFNAAQPTVPTICSHIDNVYYPLKDRYNLTDIRGYTTSKKINKSNPVQVYLDRKEKLERHKHERKR